jgi:outer membrane protein, heavy metal efflux system
VIRFIQWNRSRPATGLWLGAAVIGLAGCLPLRAPEAGDRPLVRETLPVASPLGSASPEGGVAGIVTEVIERNPALLASWSDFEAALQRIPQVTSLSEPQVTATVFLEEVQTRTGPQEFILGIQQRFPWFGVLDLRGQVAWEMAQEALQRHLTAMLASARRAQGLWWEIAYQKSARQIALEEIDLLEGFADIAASRYATGVGSQQSVLRGEVELARVQEQMIGIDERIAALSVELSALRDRASTSIVDVPALTEVSLPSFAFDVSSLIASAEALRPELTELRHRLERHERERRLARSEFYPDLMVGANWIGIGHRPDGVHPSGEGDDAVNLVVGASLPIWWRSYRAAVAEADRRIEATEQRLRDTENRIASEIVTAHLAATEALDLIDLYTSSLIPLAEQTLEASEAGFAAGQLTFLDLIDAERMLLRLRLAQERARRDHLLAIADVERAVGAALIPRAPSATASQEVTQP